MSGHIAKGEFDREARRILPRLMVAGARLVPVPGGLRYGVETVRTRGGKPRTRIDARFVAAFHKAALIEKMEDDAYRLTAEGEAFVARAQSPGDGFRAQHRVDGVRHIDGRGADAPRGLARTPVNLAETPLGWLRRRKGADGKPLISETQYEAGERLRADFTTAQMTPRVTANWSLPLSSSQRNAGGQVEASGVALAARERFYRALEAAGPGLADALVDVCCHLHGLEAAERRMGWPQRAGKVVLAIALDRLAEHYGFYGPAEKSRRLRLWRKDMDREGSVPNE